MSEGVESDVIIPGQKPPEEKIDESPGKVGLEENEKKILPGEIEGEVEADIVPITPKENEEKTPPSFEIPTGRSRATPEENEENDDETPKNSGRKKSVYLEKVVNKALTDILEDLKEIHSVSYQKDVKKTAEKIGKNVMFLNETLKGNL